MITNEHDTHLLMGYKGNANYTIDCIHSHNDNIIADHTNPLLLYLN
jgi:hypothetical protein